MDANPQYTNRLAHETSPYLVQHADNPVDWYPWGAEAFEAARQQDKPVFLSIGYSTCHWCHVMEHESFEDEQVAELMNDAFINIKVDREERPDVDDVYMQVCQMMTGSGGWPLTIIMTPEKKPFFAGTYIPKRSRYGRLGMIELVGIINDMWANEREKLMHTSDTIVEALQKTSATTSGRNIGIPGIKSTYDNLRNSYDPTFGGFGVAPKFPLPHYLTFLLRYEHRFGEPESLKMVEGTLQAMRRGGIFDHVGFGFHRYSTDHKWFLPHFEKMLYDQALIASACLETFQATGKEDYARMAREIFTYILRDMTDPAGGFYTAEDADSEGEEGKFYVWSYQELRDLLSPDDFQLVVDIYNVRPDGNFSEEATGEETGKNILHLTRPLDQWAEERNIPAGELRAKLEDIRITLYDVRERRVHPLKDTKILTDWNGLMIAALAKGGRVLNEPDYTDAAERAAQFILDDLTTPDGRLLHVAGRQKEAIPGFLDDYAFFIHGLIELYESTFNVSYLTHAIALTEITQRDFSADDSRNDGGFYFTPDNGETLLIRRKEIYDGAVPSGNSFMMLNLLKLSRITGKMDWEDQAMDIARAFSEQVLRRPEGYAQLMIAVDFAVGPGHEIVIAGHPEKSETRAVLTSLYGRFLPNKVVLFRPVSSEYRDEILDISPFLEHHAARDGQTTIYVCQNYSCKHPVADAERMWQLIEEKKKNNQ